MLAPWKTNNDKPRQGIKKQRHHFAGKCLFKAMGFPVVMHRCGEGSDNPLQYSCLENPMDRRSLVGYSPWGCEELDTTERLHFHFSLSCIGEENGNPLQCSCLENPGDSGACWAAVCGVAQSQTQLKQLNSSSSSMHRCKSWTIKKAEH